MTIVDGLHHLVGHPELTLYLMPGPALRMQLNGTIRDRQAVFRGGKERHFCATFATLIANTWQIMPSKQYDEAMLKMLDELDAKRDAAALASTEPAV